MSLITQVRPAIEIAAAAWNLSPDLVEAVVWQESSYRTTAYRFEPGFWRAYLAPKREWAKQQPERVSASYGLMQVMFPVACERGFRGQPEELFVPAVGLHYGCAQLAYLVTWAHGGRPGTPLPQPVSLVPGYTAVILNAVLAAYNGGKGGNAPDTVPDRNRGYADEVTAKLRRIQTRRESEMLNV